MSRVGFGLGSVGLCLVLAACSSTGAADDIGDSQGAATEVTAAAPISSFASTSVSRTVDVDGIPAKQFLASTSMSAVLGRMNKFADGLFAASAFEVSAPFAKSSFEDKFNCHARGNNIAFPLMFRAGGPDEDKDQGGHLGFFTKWDPESERMSCTAIVPKPGVKPLDAAIAAFKKMQLVMQTKSTIDEDKTVSAAEKKQFAADIVAVVQALEHERGAGVLYRCHWDNTDDTDADALMTLDYGKDKVTARVLLGWVQP